MPRSRRSRSLTVSRMTETVRLRARGASQREIARSLGMTQGGVSKALRKAEERLRVTIPEEVREQRRQAASRLELLYERSWAEFVATRNPKFLELARVAVSDLRKLHGLDAPSRTQVTASITTRQVSEFEAIEDAELLKLAMEEFAKLNQQIETDPSFERAMREMEGVQVTWPELPDDVDAVVVTPRERALLPPAPRDAEGNRAGTAIKPTEASRPV
jgi:hypothetical protein